jgi:shikimate kinase
MLVFLIGYMGSGKTTLGKVLARSMNCTFLDSDSIFEKQEGKSIPEFFMEHGEKAFREKERQILESLCGEKDAVIATGGGMPCYRDNLELMNRAGVTIYFKLSPEKLYERLKGGEDSRPLLKEVASVGLREHIINHLKVREPYYLQAKFIFNPTGSGIAELARSLSEL